MSRWVSSVWRPSRSAGRSTCTSRRGPRSSGRRSCSSPTSSTASSPPSRCSRRGCVSAVLLALLMWRVRLLLRGRAHLGRGEAVGFGVLLFTLLSGSVVLFLGSLPFVYHEAYAWAIAMALGATFCLVGLLDRPTTRGAVAAGAFTLGAILSRTTAGWACAGGLILAAGWFARRPERRGPTTPLGGHARGRRHAPVGRRRGSELGQVPPPVHLPARGPGVDEHERSTPSRAGRQRRRPGVTERPARHDRELLPPGRHPLHRGVPVHHPAGRGPTELRGIVPRPGVPDRQRRGLHAAAGAVDPLGPASRRSDGAWPRSARNLRIPLVSVAVIPGAIMFYGYIAMRYTAEFIPLFALAGSVGLIDIARRLAERPKLARPAFAALGVLVVFGFAANLAVSVSDGPDRQPGAAARPVPSRSKPSSAMSRRGGRSTSASTKRPRSRTPAPPIASRSSTTATPPTWARGIPWLRGSRSPRRSASGTSRCSVPPDRARQRDPRSG